MVETEKGFIAAKNSVFRTFLFDALDEKVCTKTKYEM